MAYPSIAPSMCSAQSIPFPTLGNIQVINLSANLVTNFSASVEEIYNYNNGAVQVSNLDFCNITVTYTHPGQNDAITMEAWLPTTTWNGRLTSVGGGGYLAGRFFLSYQFMISAIAQGYMTMTSDGGHTPDLDAPVSSWALKSDGTVDLVALENFASVTLNDTAYMAKQLSASTYGQAPVYSYWTGCSQGGRQGLMLAQRYPDAYDGIAASAPAIHWSNFITADHWPQLIMKVMDKYPRSCELDALTAAAIEACDAEDGVSDGIISNPQACCFDPFTQVGKSINCSQIESPVAISMEAAIVANESWSGARSLNGTLVGFPLTKGTWLTGGVATQADTLCSSNGTCTGQPNGLAVNWMQNWIYKDPQYDLTRLNTFEEFDRIFRLGHELYDPIIGSDNPDLSAFRARNGKILSYHGLADEIIPPSVSQTYYDAVAALDPQVHEFYRLFESPGLAHCSGGPGANPNGLFKSLVLWVENGTFPETQTAYLPPNGDGFRGQRLLCAYPKRAVYNGIGDVDSADSYSCV